ncbi:DNA cytosine methyltransferase [Lysobacter sp. CA199]|uniref:DNA cytosine methyltransferase n=1 Tax=Lysobacter sp. CA199 TaxID=3455608 RepID=UPI003F8D2216
MRYLSLFSGMEAAQLAWGPLGWDCVGVAEIDPAPCAALAHRMPGVPNLGDVVGITPHMVAALGRIDIVVGGSPCQDLSVAGRRAGLAGQRSGLFFEQLRIFDAARSLCGARWLVWENVPGAFSSNRGRDFAVVVGHMAGLDLSSPDQGWGTEGVALGPRGLVEWGVLDAQWFGVAQRRRRVFAVLDTGDWAGRPPVLLESDRLRGDLAPSREARKGAAGTAERCVGGRGGAGPNVADRERLIAGTLQAKNKSACTATTQDARAGLVVPLAFGGNNTAGAIQVATARTACASPSGRMDFDSETFIVQPVAHTLRGAGFDASEDGTGRGTPLVPMAFTQNQRDEVRPLNVAGALAARPGVKQSTYLALSDGGPKDTARVESAFVASDYKQGSFAETDTANPLTTSSDRSRAAPIATAYGFQPRIARNGRGDMGAVAAALNAQSGSTGKGDAAPCVAQHSAVRRLTPRECERLQGAPDDWTLTPNALGKPMADGPRYKMLGNSFAVPVVAWIGRQIAHAMQFDASGTHSEDRGFDD